MSESKSHKVVLITGCSSGIGFETAVKFAKSGFVTYPTMRDLAKKAPLSEQLDHPENILQLDVTDQTSINDAISQIQSKHGNIDILVNNAGYGLFGSFEDTTFEEFQEQMNTDFFGAVRLMKKIIPVMKQNRSGLVVNVSSVAGLCGFPIVSSYIASKFALEGLTESLRYELKNYGVQLTLVEPGAVKTQFFDNKIIAKNALNSSDYGDMTKGFLDLSKEIFQKATEPGIVADKILEIVTSDQILPRYHVGLDADQIIKQKKSKSDLEFEKHIRDYMLKDFFD